MTTRLDARQSRQRALLDQLSNNTDVKLDTLLNLVNDELTPPLRLRAANPTTLQLFVDAISVQTADGGEGHSRTRTIQPISGVLPSFTPGNITFPGTSGGSISATGLTLADSYTLIVASGNWIKVGLALNADGQVILSFGAVGASESLAVLPEFDTGSLPIGYVSMQNVAGTIQNVSGTKIFQFTGGGGGSSGSGSGTFKNYLESWFSGDKNIGTVSNGTVSEFGNRTTALTSWASPNTTNATIARSTDSSLRGSYNYIFSGAGSTSSDFIESPVFRIDAPDLPTPKYMYISLDAATTFSTFDLFVYLVQYNSSGVYQDVTAAELINLSTTPSKATFAVLLPATTNASDLWALRLYRTAGGNVRLDSLFVGPSVAIDGTTQSFGGDKTFFGSSIILPTNTTAGGSPVLTVSGTQSPLNKTFNSSSNVILKGGNTDGAIVRMGSNDNFNTIIEANNADRITARPAAAANADIKLHGTAGVELPVGTVAQRPSSPVAGTIRANSDSSEFEGYLNGAWQAVGGGVNELPLKNYLKTYATATVSPGTISTTSATGPVINTNWYSTSSGTAFTISAASDTSLRGATNYLTASNTAADPAGTVFFQLPYFTLEGSDFGKPISISFDTTGNTTDGHWDVVIALYSPSGTFSKLIPVAGNASSSSSTPSAKLPTGTAQFNGFFIPDATDGLYALRFRRLVGATQIRLDTIFVGPQPVRVGAAVTNWQSYTPGTQGLGTIASSESYWRRVGDTLEVLVRIGTGTHTGVEARINLPSGLTISSTGINSTANVGSYITASNTTSNVKYGPVLAVAGNSFFQLGVGEYTITNSAFTALNGNAFPSTNFFSIIARVPIANWSSNITMADRAVEEYASNDGSGGTAAGATYSTGMVSGASGSTFVSVASTTVDSSTAYLVNWSSVVQPTDAVFVEVTEDSGITWNRQSVTNLMIGRTLQNTSNYGMWYSPVSSTSGYVRFGNNGRRSDGATYAANGSAWSGIAANSAIRWRVRKVSGGAQVGYPIASSNIVGRTDGNAPASGYVGEKITWSSAPTTQSLTTSYADWTNATISLPPGIWQIVANVNIQLTTQSGAASDVEGHVQIVDGSGSLVELQRKRTRVIAINTVQVVDWKTMPFSCIVRPTSTTTYKIQARKQDNVATNTGNLMNGGSSTDYSEFYAVRIA